MQPEEISTCTLVRAQAVSVKCPYCHRWLDGLLCDPRGMDIHCECGKVFAVSLEADVELA